MTCLYVCSVCISLKFVILFSLVSVINAGSGFLVATGYGMFHRVNWEGKFDRSLVINHGAVFNRLAPEEVGNSPLIHLHNDTVESDF